MQTKAMLKLSRIAVLAAIYAVSTAVTTTVVTTSASARGHGGGHHGGGHHGGEGHHHHDEGHHHYYDGDHYHPAAAIAAAIAIGTVLNYRPHGCVVDVVDDVQYCHDGNIWYRIDGTTYIVVDRP